jgi:hypothetical protein
MSPARKVRPPTAGAQIPPSTPEVLLRSEDSQSALPLATQGVNRWVWESRYGTMLIEVVEGRIFVNGKWVQPHVR